MTHGLEASAAAAAAAGVKGRTISLKIKRRKTNAPDPPKFMGHGDCDNMSRSITLSRFTDAAAELATQGKALLKALRVDPTQIRGIGLNVRTQLRNPARFSGYEKALWHQSKHCSLLPSL